MPRTFTDEREYSYSSDEAFRIAFDTARRELPRALADDGSPIGVHASVTTSKSKATGDDFDQLLAETLADGLDPTWFYIAFYPLPMGVGDPSFVTANPVKHTVQVEVVTDDEGKALAAAEKVSRLINKAVPPTRPHGTTRDGQSKARAAVQPSPQPTSWLRRTWKDHAALAVITIVGGIIVVVVGAIILAQLHLG